MKNIKTVGVIGAGTMGSALAQKFVQEGFTVILADKEMKFVEKGLGGIKTMLNEGVAKNIFKEEEVINSLSNLKGTADLQELKICNIIIEAIFEDFKAKSDLFKALSEIVPEETIIATNTSSFSVSELSATVKHPERFIGLHYFYHAAKNRLVEIIPGTQTSATTIENAKTFCMLSGKDAIICKDVYGFAVNRFFVPWLNESVKLLSENIGTIESIDSACMKIFKIGMGPFALMNATGVSIAMHAQRTLEFFGPSYKIAPMLEQLAAKKENWKIAELNSAELNPVSNKVINERLLGCVFFICTQILNDGVCSAVDLNKGAKIGLRWKYGPVDLMKRTGEEEVKRLVNNYARHYNEAIPIVSSSSWHMDYVLLENKDDIAIITINRPEELNALNEEVINQLNEKFSQAENYSSVKTIFITGTGKAFVAGADINFFVNNIKNHSVDRIVDFTSFGQQLFEKIDKSKKKVVVILNGMALGGGLELALCADLILSVQGAKLAFPETGIGIYPGLGGAKRTARRVGKGLAKYLIYTGKKVTATHASEIGLIDSIIQKEDIPKILSGEMAIDSIPLGVKNIEERCLAIKTFFEANSLDHLLHLEYSLDHLDKEDAERIINKVKGNAPLALYVSEKLINGCDLNISELDDLKNIFISKDALIGLSSLGRNVEYKGT